MTTCLRSNMKKHEKEELESLREDVTRLKMAVDILCKRTKIKISFDKDDVLENLYKNRLLIHEELFEGLKNSKHLVTASKVKSDKAGYSENFRVLWSRPPF